jgi:hypothetical protein
LLVISFSNFNAFLPELATASGTVIAAANGATATYLSEGVSMVFAGAVLGPPLTWYAGLQNLTPAHSMVVSVDKVIDH